MVKVVAFVLIFRRRRNAEIVLAVGACKFMIR